MKPSPKTDISVVNVVAIIGALRGMSTRQADPLDAHTLRDAAAVRAAMLREDDAVKAAARAEA